MFLPKEEGCSSSSSTSSLVVNWSFHFDDAGCFPPRVPVDVRFFLGFFGADGWVGMLSLLVFTTGGVAVSVSLLLSYSYWLSSSATLRLLLCLDYLHLLWWLVMIVVPCNGPLLRSGSNNFRLYLKICRGFIYFMALGYTLRSLKPQESDLIEDGSNNFRLYLKICRSLLYFTTLGYTSRSAKPQKSDLIEDGLLNLYIFIRDA